MDNMATTVENLQTDEKTEQRIDFISLLQFVGVMSVIFGHSMNSIDVSPWLKDIKAWIYTFHMPLFFLVSAFLFAYKGGYDRGYKKVLTNRFSRLLVPYFIWNTLFIIPKIVLAPYIEDQVSLTSEYFISINLSPRNNILGHTWFLFALFEMYIIAILFDKLRRNNNLWFPIGLLLVVINCFGVTNRFLALGDLMKNSIYFWLGLLVGCFRLDNILNVLKDNSLFLSVIFNVILMSVLWFWHRDMLINTLILGISIIYLIIIIQQRFNLKNKCIDFVSNNSFPIYILHWPAMMVVRFIVNNKLHCEPYICMISMFIGGILIPTLIVLIIRKINSPYFSWINHYVFGI